MTRRGFGAGGVALLAGYGGWRWLETRSTEGGLTWPLRRFSRANESVARALFRADRLAPDFPTSGARDPRVNGVVALAGVEGVVVPVDADSWRLRVFREGAEVRPMGLAEIRGLPRFEQTTELKCIEGWSTVVRWAGARLADLAAATGVGARSGRPYDAARPPADLEYAGLATPDGRYFVGLDLAGALHPQTLLCYEMNGLPLSPEHGAPVRLVIPLKYGIKNIKRVGSIRFTDRRPADYWAERGYDWYAGH